MSQGEGKINAPGERQQGPTRKVPEGVVDNGRRRKGAGRKSGKSRRDQSLPRGEEQASSSSSLLGTTTVTIDPEQAQDAGKGGDNEKSNTDDMAVLQALYDGAPLSSVFHHDLAEGMLRYAIVCDYCIVKSYWFVHERVCNAPVLTCTWSGIIIPCVRIGGKHLGGDSAEYWTERFTFLACITGSELMTVEHKRMEEAAKRAAQKAVNQLRMSRHTLRAGAGQVTLMKHTNGRTFFVSISFIFFAFLSFSVLLVVVTQIRGHTAGSLPPLPLQYVPSFLS